MKFDRDFRVETVASTDATRTHICNVDLDVAKKRLAATNGYILAVVPCAVGDDDVSGPIPPAALAASHGYLKAGAEFAEVPDGPLYRRPSGAGFEFPPLDQVIPKFRPGRKGTLTIALDPSLLIKLAEALGVKKGMVTLTVDLPRKEEAFREVVLVLPGTDGETDRGIGVLMPARTDIAFKGPFPRPDETEVTS